MTKAKSLWCRAAVSALLALLALAPVAASAQVPQTISYQGSLTDAEGNPVEGTVAMTFNLYGDPDTPSGLLWSETQIVTVTNGTFDVILGADVANPLGPSLFESPLFLGVAVGEDAEMTPLQPLAAAAYGLRAKTVESDTLSALDCAEGEVAKFVAGAWTCAPDNINEGDITGVLAGSGLAGGGLAGDVTLSADTSVVQSRVAGICAAGSSIREILADGAVICEPDTDTTYTAGSGLLLIGPTFSVGTESIGAGHIAADAVGQSEIATGGVASLEVVDNSLTAADLAASSVGTSELADGAVSVADLSDLAKGVGVNGSITLSGVAFGPDSSTRTYVKTQSGYINPGQTNATLCILAPLSLPHGVTVTHFEIFAWDNSVDDMGPFILRRLTPGTGDWLAMAETSTTGESASVRTFTDTTITGPVVDGFSHSYIIDGCFRDDGAGKHNTRVYGARIRYN